MFLLFCCYPLSIPTKTDHVHAEVIAPALCTIQAADIPAIMATIIPRTIAAIPILLRMTAVVATPAVETVVEVAGNEF